MQQKLCLWLVAAVLIAALLGGNPFLADRSAARRVVGSDAPAATPAVSPAFALRTSGAAWRDLTPALAVSRVAAIAADASTDIVCPDAAVRPDVAAVERDANGEPVWVLRDGSRWVRNPNQGAGEPLLLRIAASATK